MEKEIWKDIEGFEGLYQVSNLGNVKSLNYNRTKTEKILKPCKNEYGYFQVNLYKEGKRKMIRVNRLVADAFIQNKENKPEVGHKDDDKSNNSFENLYFTDHKTNCNDGSRNKKISGARINNKKISKKVLCIETNKIYPSTKEAQRRTEIANESISRCCNGRYKTAGGFHWKYV